MKIKSLPLNFLLLLTVTFFITPHLVRSQSPVANFTVSPNVVCIGEPVQFTDMSTGNPTSWQWTFTNGAPATSTLQNPVVVYQSFGSFSAVLQASNVNGANSTGKLNVVKANGCVGLEDLDPELDLTVYPNPVQSVLQVMSVSEKSFSLTNVLGAELISGTLPASETQNISLEMYPPGVYYLTVRERNKSKTLKIIKE